MLTLYVAAMTFGGVLLGASVLLGDHDADADADVDFDVDGDVDLDVDGDVDFDVDGDADAGVDADGGHDLVHAGGGADWIWLPLLSLRVWGFGSAAFGAIGTILSLVGISAGIVAVTAVTVGTGVGYTVTWAYHRLRDDVVTGALGLEAFVGSEGTVMLGVAPGRTGTIRLETAAGDLILPASTHDEERLDAGRKVLIVRFVGRRAEVSGLPSSPGGRRLTDSREQAS